jgi:hypothetical protein
VEYTIPRDGAVDVPTNAILSAIYGTGAFDDGTGRVTLEEVGGEEVMLTATLDALQSLTVSPALKPNTDYVVKWPGLFTAVTSNVDGGEPPLPVRGSGREVQFSTGSAEDERAPTFGDGLLGVSWNYEREFDGCSDSFSERYLFHFEPSEPEDDAPVDLLSVVILQSEGHSSGSVQQVGRRPYRPGEPVTVRQIAANAVGHVCFRAVVEDSAGHSTNPSPAVCADTDQPPFFEGCSVARHTTGGPWPLSLLLMLSGGLGFHFWRRSTRRKP